MDEERYRKHKKLNKRLWIIVAALLALTISINACFGGNDKKDDMEEFVEVERNATRDDVKEEQTQENTLPVEVNDQEEKVLITNTGTKYHRYACTDGNFFEVTLEQAKSMGLSPCKKCYGG